MIDPSVRRVEISIALRVRCPSEPGRMAAALRILRNAGGPIRASLIYRVYEMVVGLLLCERPEEGALALLEAGIDAETETVVAARIERRPDAFRHLLETIEAHRIPVGYAYATDGGDSLLAIFRTEDNPAAEDALRGYLFPADPSEPEDPF